MVATESDNPQAASSLVRLFLGRSPRNQREEDIWTIAAIVYIAGNLAALLAGILIH